MNFEQAREILGNYRLGTPITPEVGEALRLAEVDAALEAWWKSERHLNGLLRESLAGVRPPAGLREKILLETKVVRLPFGFRLWRKEAVAAAAAAVILFIGAAIGWSESRPPRFETFREEMMFASWRGEPHVGIEESDFATLKKWLVQHGAAANFEVPRELDHLHLRGCRIVSWHGHKVPLFCFLDGPRHIHLIVTERSRFADAPGSDGPDLEHIGRFLTASWSSEGKAYILSGVKARAFVSKFRRAGQWTWNS